MEYDHSAFSVDPADHYSAYDLGTEYTFDDSDFVLERPPTSPTLPERDSLPLPLEFAEPLTAPPPTSSPPAPSPPMERPPTKPKSDFKTGDFAMIMTSNPSSKLNGLGVTIKRCNYVPTGRTCSYTCASEDFGDTVSTLTVAAADLRKPKWKLGDLVELWVRFNGKPRKADGTVREVLTEKGKFEYMVDLGEARVEEKNIIG